MPQYVKECLIRNCSWLGRDVAHQLKGSQDVTEAEALAQGGVAFMAAVRAHCTRLGLTERQIPREAFEAARTAYLQRMTGES